MRHVFADLHRVDELDLLAVDREHADRVVGAVGNQCEVAGAVDRHAGRLAADICDRFDQAGRIRCQVDHMQPTGGPRFPAGAVDGVLDRVRYQRELAIRRNREVSRRAEDRIRERQRRDDLRVGGIGTDVDDRDYVLAGRAEHELPARVPRRLVVNADDHVLGLTRQRAIHGCTSGERRRGAHQRQSKKSIHHGLLVRNSDAFVARVGTTVVSRATYRAHPRVSTYRLPHPKPDEFSPWALPIAIAFMTFAGLPCGVCQPDLQLHRWSRRR